MGYLSTGAKGDTSATYKTHTASADMDVQMGLLTREAQGSRRFMA
jgi:hypothetical protein